MFDAFEQDPTYMRKKMFGCDAAYVDGRLCLVAADRDAPWNGLLVCTSQDQHAALVEEISALRPHPVLGKWLYVPQTDPAFEDAVQAITLLVRNRDSRIGVEPKPRKPRRQAAQPTR
jgi:lipocalin